VREEDTLKRKEGFRGKTRTIRLNAPSKKEKRTVVLLAKFCKGGETKEAAVRLGGRQEKKK